MTIGPIPSQPTNNNSNPNISLRPPIFCPECGYEGKAVLGGFIHCYCCDDEFEMADPYSDFIYCDEKDYQQGQ